MFLHRPLLFSTLLTLLACAPPNVSAPPSAPSIASGIADARTPNVTPVDRPGTEITVRVHDARRSPVTNVLVAFTSTDATVPIVRTTNERGEANFVLASTSGTMTAMTTNGFASTVLEPEGPDSVLLALDPQCSAFDGVVSDQSAPSGAPSIDMVHVFPYGTSISPAFTATVDATARFRGCLPPGRYFVDGELSEVGGGVLFDVPAPEQITYVATREVAAKTPPPRERIPAYSLEQAVRELSGDVGVVALGESTHGTAEFALERARFTIALAKTRRVRFVLLEAGFGETLALDRYVRDGTGDVRKAVAALRFWMWDTEEFIHSVELVRAFNKKRPRKDRIGFVGTDVQMAGGAVSFLLEDGAKTLNSDDRAALAKVPDLDPSTWINLPDEEKRKVRQVLGRLAKPRHPNDFRALTAASIEARLDSIVTGPELEHMRVRDRLMAEMTLRITDNGKHLSVVWAHMGHITKRWMFGQETMGGVLQARLGAKYTALAMLGASGSTRAWDSERRVGVISHLLEEAPSYSIEGALSNDDPNPQYVLFADLPPAVYDWISKIRYLRFIGSTFPKSGGGWVLYDVGHGFDGVVIFRSATSTTPTQTGIRKAETN